jgi:GAF domain-containing protein
MAQQLQRAITLRDVLVTDKLAQRSSRAPNLTSENRSLHNLALSLVNPPMQVLRQLLESALELCDAGSAGISLLETSPEGNQVFRWIALAGQYAAYVGGCAPRDSSPCGATLERNAPQLFSYPARLFTYLNEAQPEIVEGLVVPFGADGKHLGTIWIVSHSTKVELDREDVRIMISLASFAAAAVRILQLESKCLPQHSE